METDEKIAFFLELMSCSQSISYWEFGTDGSIQKSTSPYRDIGSFLRLTFGEIGGMQTLVAMGNASRTPVIVTTNADLVWAVVFSYADGAVARLHALGPLYNSDVTVDSIEKKLDKHYMSHRFRRTAINMLAGQPVLSATRFWPYVQMLHYTVHGEKLGFDAFRFMDPRTLHKEEKNLHADEEETSRDAHVHAGVYATQTELFSKIENGDIHYASALNNAVSKASYGSNTYETPMEKANAYAVKFITLSMEAAIRGGVAPVIAYSVGDYYEKQVAVTKSLAEKKHILDTMFDDFVRRVHALKKRTDLSKPIQTCCDYINLHINEQIKLEELAKVVCYTKYYLPRKFKQEIGMSIWDYVNERKVDRAKLLLKDPALTIQDVSDMLSYCSRSYFSEVFQKCTGMWPSNYRATELNM